MKILVIGDSCIDKFVYGSIERICPEAPVPVLNPVRETTNPGMAGNVVENLKSLGAEVDLITNPETIRKTRYVDLKSNQMIIRVDENDSVPNSFSCDDLDFGIYDAIVVSDYCKGFLSLTNLHEISVQHPLTFLDTKKLLHKGYMSSFTFIKINEDEWKRTQFLVDPMDYLQEKLIITVSERGCIYNNIHYPASDNIEVKDISGAGDTFLAALVFNFVETKDISQSILFANHCAGIVVKKKGVAVI